MGRRPLTLALTAVLVAAAAAAWFGYRWNEHRVADQTRAEAVSAARQAMKNFMEVNPASLDTDMQRVADSATGDFKAEFEDDRATLKKTYEEKKIEAHGEVLAAAADARNSDRDSVRVLLVVDQNVKAGTSSQLRHYRLQLDMVSEGDRWLVSTLSFVS
jgi:Mce-associated membrane protein